MDSRTTFCVLSMLLYFNYLLVGYTIPKKKKKQTNKFQNYVKYIMYLLTFSLPFLVFTHNLSM